MFFFFMSTFTVDANKKIKRKLCSSTKAKPTQLFYLKNTYSIVSTVA